MGGVNDIPDAELIRRVVQGRLKPRSPRWVMVGERFSLGSTYAAQLCRRFGMDPDEIRKPRHPKDMRSGGDG